MTSVWVPAAAGVLFATLAFLGTVVARAVTVGARSFADGPPPGRPAIGILVCAAALTGTFIGLRGVTLHELATACVLTIALAGICYADVRYGLVPDVFTLGPLGAVLATDVLLQAWSGPLAVLFVAGPFAVAAKISKGRGMGWGDVKLVALGAAVLGAEQALLSFAVACFAAVAIAAIRRRRSVAIAFAPYLAAAIAIGVASHGVR